MSAEWSNTRPAALGTMPPRPLKSRDIADVIKRLKAQVPIDKQPNYKGLIKELDDVLFIAGYTAPECQMQNWLQLSKTLYSWLPLPTDPSSQEWMRNMGAIIEGRI